MGELARWLGRGGLALALAVVAYPAAAQAPTTTARTVTVAGMSRAYRLHVPASLPRDRAVALVLVFHGGGGTPAWAERESRFSELADREGFLVAYPQGHRKSWNDGRADASIAAQRDGVDDLGFVAALIDDVARDHTVDAKRVFATGMSNGATFSHYLAARLSTRIAAIAPVAGGLAAPLAAAFGPERPVSVLVIHGTRDPLVHYQGGEITLPWGATRGAVVGTEPAVEAWAAHDGCEARPVAVDLPDKDPADGTRVRRLSYGACRDGTAVVLYRIEGGGHTWPGGLQYLPRGVIGTLSRDLDATETIWEFFKQHPKP